MVLLVCEYVGRLFRLATVKHASFPYILRYLHPILCDYVESDPHLLCCAFAADPGEEHGYVVKLTDDTLDPPYPMKPGQAIRLSVTYDSTTDHFGVMAFMYVTMSGWDPTCPGNPTGLSSAPDLIIFAP